MKVFQDLTISGSPEALNRVLSEIDAAMESQAGGRWTRRPDNEDNIRRHRLALSEFRHERCYEVRRSPEEGHSAHLWLVRRNDNEIYVSNVVPVQTGSLGMNGYNQILQEFYTSFVRSAAHQAGARVKITDEEQTLEDWTAPEVAEHLRRFSSSANKSTGSSHPADKERWHAFIVESHKSGRPLRGDLLKRWLIEEEGWPEETSIDLAIEYEQGLDLLGYYDRLS